MTGMCESWCWIDSNASETLVNSAVYMMFSMKIRNEIGMESNNPQATIPRRQKNVVITKKKICKSKIGSNDNYNDEDDNLYNVIVK